MGRMGAFWHRRVYSLDISVGLSSSVLFLFRNSILCNPFSTTTGYTENASLMEKQKLDKLHNIL